MGEKQISLGMLELKFLSIGLIENDGPAKAENQKPHHVGFCYGGLMRNKQRDLNHFGKKALTNT